MPRTFLKRIVLAAALSAAVVPGTAAHAQDDLTYGSAEEVAFAERLWTAMADARLVGPDAIQARPYEGVEPHGAILVTLQTEIEVDGHSDDVIVKNNYMGEDVSVQSVSDNPDLNLASVTVMYRRAAGYDPENLDWFWTKYNADGTLQTNPDGVPLAGRIGANPLDACIACHKFAPGEDYVFLNDTLAR